MNGCSTSTAAPVLRRALKVCSLAIACTTVLTTGANAAVTQCVGTTSASLCPPNVTNCTISTSVEIAAGSVLDCSGINLSLSTIYADLWVANGSFSLTANSLTVAQGGRIRAVPHSTIPTGFAITVAQQINVSGKLEAPNGRVGAAANGSFISLQAGGNVTLGVSTPVIDLAGTSDRCDGGDLTILSGGAVTISKRIDAHGKDGGGEDNYNIGGRILIDAVGNIVVNDEIRAHGRDLDGGFVELFSDGSVTIDHQTGTNLPKGEIDIEGRLINGWGGYLGIVAANAISVSGPIHGAGGVGTTGGYSIGAIVELIAGCGGVSISDDIEVWAGELGGGALIVDSDGPVTISSAIDATARRYGGPGGSVDVSSGKLLTLTKTALIQVDGHNPSSSADNGHAGYVSLRGCQVDLLDDSSTGATITALGWHGGDIAIHGAKTSLTSSQTSVRVGDKAFLSGVGESVSGQPRLRVKERRLGVCSNSSTTCQINSECPDGVCNGANPDTQGTLAQFTPTASIVHSPTMTACPTVCP